jgi:predicted nuclease of predicted toxin-antitoxin system
VRWLADECTDAYLVARLREAGHDVTYAAETQQSASDEEIIDIARDGGRLLLTEDRDFGELTFRQGRVAPGIVLLRIEQPNHPLKWARLNAAISRFGEGLFGRFTVVEEARFRSRPLLDWRYSP